MHGKAVTVVVVLLPFEQVLTAQSLIGPSLETKKIQDMHVISDPLGQTHSPATSDHYSRLNFDGRTDIQHVPKL